MRLTLLNMDLQKKIFAVITGASQGIGRSIAIELSKYLGEDSALTLIARDIKALINLKETILFTNSNISVNIIALDLTNPDVTKLEEMFNISTEYYYALIFHNVGQIGSLTSAVELTDRQKWHDYFDLNLFSVGILNSVFVKCMRRWVSQHITIVNISSLCGTKPIANLAMYGAGKAARNLYFQVLAVEERDVNVLNYNPGPVDTAMAEEIITNATDVSLKKMMVEFKESQTILKPIQTVSKLLTILQEGRYKSGDVVDYYEYV